MGRTDGQHTVGDGTYVVSGGTDVRDGPSVERTSLVGGRTVGRTDNKRSYGGLGGRTVVQMEERTAHVSVRRTDGRTVGSTDVAWRGVAWWTDGWMGCRRTDGGSVGRRSVRPDGRTVWPTEERTADVVWVVPTVGRSDVVR